MLLKYESTVASIEEVNAVTAMASQSKAAKEKYSELLKDHPTPNKRELEEIKEEINEILVLEHSRNITGNTELTK